MNRPIGRAPWNTIFCMAWFCALGGMARRTTGDEPPIVAETAKAQEAEHDPSSEDDSDHTNPSAREIASDEKKADKPWHLDLGLRLAYPKLHRTKRMLDRRLDDPLKFDVFNVFQDPYSPIDRKTDFGYVSSFAGIGRAETSWFLWTAYLGGGAGKDPNKDRFLNTTLEVDFEYEYYFIGLAAEIYPFLRPEGRPKMTVSECLSASRPFLYTAVEGGYVRGEGEGTYRINGIPAYHDEEEIRDWVSGLVTGLGWAIPIDVDWSFVLTGDYKFDFRKPDEYSGWNVLTAIRYEF